MKNNFGDTALEYAKRNASDELNQVINDGIATFDFNTQPSAAQIFCQRTWD